MLTYGAETWAMKAGVFQRLQATGKTFRMIYGVTLKDMVESMVIASRVEVDDLGEHLRWFGHIVRRHEKVEIKSVGVENRMERGRLMKMRVVVQQDAGDREGWRRRAVKGLANPR